MKKILLVLIVGLLFCLFSCGSSEIEGGYTVTDFYYPKDAYETVEKWQENTNRARPLVLGAKLLLTKYDNSIILSLQDGEYYELKKLDNVAFNRVTKRLYTTTIKSTLYSQTPGGSLDYSNPLERVTNYEIVINRKKIILKLNRWFLGDEREVFVLTKTETTN